MTAVGYPIRDPDGSTVAAVSVSLPASRFTERRLPGLVAALNLCARAIERGVARDTPGANEP